MKIRVLILMLVVFSIISILPVYAGVNTCTLVTPAGSAVIKDTALFNITWSDTNSTGVLTGVVYASSSGTDNSTVVLVGNKTNGTTTAYGSVNISISTLGFVDNNNWAIYAVCYNGTGAGSGVTSSTNNNIIVDNTVPAFGKTTNFSNTDNNIQVITFNVSNAKQYRFFHNGLMEETKTITASLSGVSFTRTIQATDSGSYYLDATDGTNTTTSGTTTYTLMGDTKSGRNTIISKPVVASIVTGQTTQQKASVDNTFAIFLVISAVLSIVLVTIFVAASKKGKRYRR